MTQIINLLDKEVTKPNNDEVEILMSHLPNDSLESFQRMTFGAIHKDEQVALACVYRLLASDHSIDLIMPLVCTDMFLSLANSANINKLCDVLSKTCPELASLVLASARVSPDGNPHHDILSLVTFIAMAVKHMHELDIQPEAPDIKENT